MSCEKGPKMLDTLWGIFNNKTGFYNMKNQMRFQNGETQVGSSRLEVSQDRLKRTNMAYTCGAHADIPLARARSYTGWR